MWSLAILGFFLASAQGRAVNISNTWVLPEEGFPVFYRYFRDRISWYEADAVCQFHHANLVTVDTTAQYDAVRAYLKELDISSAVWVGLIRSNPDGDFTWTDYRGLSGDGYWSSAPDPRAAPLCAAADPAADYRWEARACGGPTVASFICELPVPQWALGNEGCMVKALPALTVLYLPESAAVQLTADCGMAGVKRVQCTGNVKREDLLRGLSCAEEQESSTNSGATSGTPLTSSERLFTDQDTTNDATTEDNTSSGHTDDGEQSSTSIPHFTYNPQPIIITTQQNVEKVSNAFYDKHVHFESNSNINNMQSNDIPKLAAGYDNYLSSDLSDKLEDERHMQHKMIHDEIARHGNLQTTDHFVPPLVMAKAKISDDMTVLSLEEKHAQQLAEQKYGKHTHNDNFSLGSKAITSQSTIDDTEKINIHETPLITTTPQNKPRDDLKKDVQKPIAPKKYVDKQYGHKNKILKVIDLKSAKIDKTTEVNYLTTTEKSRNDRETSTIKYTTVNENFHKIDDEPTIDLTVIIREPSTLNNKNLPVENMNIPKIEIIENDTSVIEPKISLSNPENNDGEITQEISVKLPTKSVNNVTFTHEVIKITIVKDENSSEEPTVFEVTTKMPIFEDDNLNISNKPVINDLNIDTVISNNNTNRTNEVLSTSSTKFMPETTVENIKATSHDDFVLSTVKPTNITKEVFTTNSNHVMSTTDSTLLTAIDNGTETNEKVNDNSNPFSNFKTTTEDDTHIDEDIYNTTDTSQTMDDFQSPLLSGANEPVHRPNRSRRPQQPNKNKFNPFRILG